MENNISQSHITGIPLYDPLKSEIENSYFITFQFVRGDGNRNNYQANMSNIKPLFCNCAMELILDF